MSMPTCTSAKRERILYARPQGRRERERERRQFKLNMLAARTNFLNYGEPDDRVTRLAMNNAGFRYALDMTAHT